eukprot:CAMPEP_0195524126 /NCGR_PEP_ID=MMETSP0794_2-20130614/23795_1 /TAXON_ID=515487 /ORGANISM="Stephanopyxis turris, Strain CCMP 815" /LENGTH=127 /DNA_ID=CAMNT_0040654287 /DNA_START=189 /DNA_END=572 /DNA_ORIENTATION=+
MGCVYMTIPIVGGYYMMQWAIEKSHKSIGAKGELLQIKDVEGLGDLAVINGERKKVGAGGVLGGVKLAVSDKNDQDRNKKMLEKFLKNEQRKKRAREGQKSSEKKVMKRHQGGVHEVKSELLVSSTK